MADKVTLVISVGNGGTDQIGKDGIREQIEILGQLSKKLDEYFVMRSLGPDWRDSR
jgi:hypothetical protein